MAVAPVTAAADLAIMWGSAGNGQYVVMAQMANFL